MAGKLALDFVQGSVVPRMEQLEAMADDTMVSLLKEAGPLGLLAVDVPVQYGGMEMSKAASMLVAEKLQASGSFQVGHGAHTGIGTLPIVFFGTPEQKERYLPRLATGEIIGAYALTESGSGSDSLAARARATLSEDGSHYVLSGEKMFITNAGFADLFIVFAQVDGTKFTAFIVERQWEGVSTGPEERKMGIKGSSTRPLVLDGVKVPVENVLGRVGRGSTIAFNILHVGRFKLGAGVIGAAELALVEAVCYAKQRQQFGHAITEFGLIKHKIGEMAARVFAGRSMVYRTAGSIDGNIALLDKSDPDYGRKVVAKGINEYAVECAMLKVYCSEVLDYCTDESLQLHGGYGFTQEFNVERYYRDSRINRIFEGTNEINRLIVGGELFKKAAKKKVAVLERGHALLERLGGGDGPLAVDVPAGGMAAERERVARAKLALQLVVTEVLDRLGMAAVREEQEIQGLAADALMEIYAMESALLRAAKLAAAGEGWRAESSADMVRLLCNDGLHRVAGWCRDMLAASLPAGEREAALERLERVTRQDPEDTVSLRRRIADVVIEKEACPL